MSLRRKRSAVALTVSAVLIAGLFALGPISGGASSHREAPMIAGDPAVDATDFFMFRSPNTVDATQGDDVVLVANFWPFEEPAGGPNFYPFDPSARYEFNIDNDGDAVADWIYRFKFSSSYQNPNTFLYNTGPVTSLSDADLNFRQTYDLTKVNVDNGKSQLLLDNAPVVPSDVGNASMPNYAGDLWSAGDRDFAGGVSFAGQSDDPFYLDLRVFNLLYGGNLSETGDDTLTGFNTNAIVLQIDDDKLAKGGNATTNPIIGGWTTTSRKSTAVTNPNGTRTYTGNWVQISRLGAPLVNEVVIPVGLKDKWNGSKPTGDGQFLSYVQDPEVARLIEAVYSIPAPATPRNDLVEIFLTGINGLNQPAGVVPSEQLRLNMSTPTCESGDCAEYSRLGVIDGDVAGYPNGRRLGDDVIDISLTAIEQTTLGDGVNANDEGFGAEFPYLAAPSDGSENDPH